MWSTCTAWLGTFSDFCYYLPINLGKISIITNHGEMLVIKGRLRLNDRWTFDNLPSSHNVEMIPKNECMKF